MITLNEQQLFKQANISRLSIANTLLKPLIKIIMQTCYKITYLHLTFDTN